MNDQQLDKKTAAASEAAAVAGHHGSRAAEIQAGLMRYLAAEAYREKVEKTRKGEHAEEEEDSR